MTAASPIPWAGSQRETWDSKVVSSAFIVGKVAIILLTRENKRKTKVLFGLDQEHLPTTTNSKSPETPQCVCVMSQAKYFEWEIVVIEC